MADPHIRAAFYLSPTLDQSWRWEDDAQVLAWFDGHTIAFYPEVERIIERLAPGGLPPFGAVVLLLAACRDGWIESPGRKIVAAHAASLIQTVDESRAVRGPGIGMSVAGGRLSAELNRLLDGLDAVSRLPQTLRDTQAKVVLAEMVFEPSQNRGTPDDGVLILRGMSEGLSAETLRPQLSTSDAQLEFVRQIGDMGRGLSRVTAESLAQRIKTGINEPVRPAPKELAPPAKVRQLLAELRTDDELSGLAKLAHDLMAAVAVPRSLRHREELPMGGVSDLTNRGSLDRLLISELAQDDLTLAVRVAVNEAIYLRRESPPKEPPHHRLILIDAGVRMWGVPRVFATAIALALSATGDPAAELKVYRAAGAAIDPVDLTTREGLIAHLAALETAAHPGAAMTAFSEAIMATEKDGIADAFVLTHADAAVDEDFVDAIRAAGRPAIYIGSVERDGRFRLVARTRQGDRPVREAELSLDELLAPPRPKRPREVPLVDEKRKRDDLPAIFFARRFPFLLPHRVDPARSTSSKENGLVSITTDGRLLHWADDRKRGARQVSDGIPNGQVRLLELTDAFGIALWGFLTTPGQAAGHLVVSDLQEKTTVVPLNMRHRSPIACFVRGTRLFIVYHGHVDAHHGVDGCLAASLNLPPRARWHRGRFFRVGSEFRTISYDGTATLQLEPVPVEPEAQAIFDRPGHEGFWTISPGLIVGHTTGIELRLPPHLNAEYVSDISTDGRWLHFNSARRDAGGGYMLDLDGAASDVRLPDIQQWRRSRLGLPLRWSENAPLQLRKKYSAIGVSLEGELTLGIRGGKNRQVVTVSGDRLELITRKNEGPELAASRWLTPLPRRDGLRIPQKIVRWPDGSEAWLDNRCLLHLRSSDRSIPELTLVLRAEHGILPGQIAAWSSTGKVTGPSYFLGDAESTDASYFMDIIGRFVERLRS